ncbi:uncharacterized protein A1O9_13154 [Exophiala aquamarina CBS 119918]|uniref:BTB domain-containing protein n=1 Tax=Exophiala aquamarina CBS 119918 TaxID=1182545 RepID=A0A072NT78_9EURO|nr:uncharacterized protein A1O9_13154 [Exophiala aquamarina CBS 119918]KEF50796.1 hypothetical protein A1O9_13154 [Exophiala aquamarina CBS 119918]
MFEASPHFAAARLSSGSYSGIKRRAVSAQRCFDPNRECPLITVPFCSPMAKKKGTQAPAAATTRTATTTRSVSNSTPSSEPALAAAPRPSHATSRGDVTTNVPNCDSRGQAQAGRAATGNGSVFSSRIVTIQVGHDRAPFSIHSGFLSPSKVLCQKVQVSGQENSVVLKDVEKAAFEILLCYLYGQDYERFDSTLNPRLPDGQAPACLLTRCGILLRLGIQLDIPSLQEEAMGRILSIEQVDYASIMTVAQKMFQSPTTPDARFLSWFREQTRTALRARRLEDEDYVLDAIRASGGPLCLELFTSLRDHRSRRSSLPSLSSATHSDMSDEGSFTEQLDQEIEGLSLDGHGAAAEGGSPPGRQDLRGEDEGEAIAAADVLEEADQSAVVVDMAEVVQLQMASHHEVSSSPGEAPALPPDTACSHRETHLADPIRWRFCGQCREEIMSIVRALRS